MLRGPRVCRVRSGAVCGLGGTGGARGWWLQRDPAPCRWGEGVSGGGGGPEALGTGERCRAFRKAAPHVSAGTGQSLPAGGSRALALSRGLEGVSGALPPPRGAGCLGTGACVVWGVTCGVPGGSSAQAVLSSGPSPREESSCSIEVLLVPACVTVSSAPPTPQRLTSQSRPFSTLGLRPRESGLDEGRLHQRRANETLFSRRGTVTLPCT